MTMTIGWLYTKLKIKIHFKAIASVDTMIKLYLYYSIDLKIQ